MKQNSHISETLFSSFTITLFFLTLGYSSSINLSYFSLTLTGRMDCDAWASTIQWQIVVNMFTFCHAMLLRSSQFNFEQLVDTNI